MITIEPNEEQVSDMRRMFQIKTQMDKLKKEYDELRDILQGEIDVDSVCYPLGNGWKMQLKKNIRHSVDNKALKAAIEEHPALAEGFRVSYDISNPDILTKEQQAFVTTKEAPPTIKFVN